jgi:hypothetical protein
MQNDDLSEERDPFLQPPRHGAGVGLDEAEGIQSAEAEP